MTDSEISAERAGAYEIVYEPDDGILRLVLVGHWELEDLAAFGSDLNRCARAAIERDGDFKLLSDSRAFKIQSPEVSDGFARLVRDRQRGANALSAIVVSSSLNRLQVQDSMATPGLRVFTDLGTAREWLLRDGDRS